jgi:hypothetical protein
MPPATDPLVGVKAKLDRAKQHLSDFDKVRARSRDTNKDMIRHKEKPDTEQRVYYVAREPITTDFAVFVGDVIHNLRSALDHLAYAICIAGPGGYAVAEREEKLIYFPVCDGDADAYRTLRSRGVIVALGKSGIEKIIDEVEPYRGGKGEVLAQINSLSNTDKHRLLMTVALNQPSVNIAAHMLENFRRSSPASFLDLGTAELQPLWVADADQSPLVAGRELFFEPIDMKANDEMQFMFNVSLNEPEVMDVQPLFPLLPNMVAFVENLLPQFVGFV